MSQLQDLTRCLLAAGGATHPEGKGTYFLYADRSTLISKHWTGSAFGDGELITDSIRPDSTATYLLSPDMKRIICISSSSTLRALHYDEDDEEWVDDEKFPDLAVHPDGRLAATLDDDGHALVFFQDASGHLIYLNTAGAPIVLPASPIAGSPIAIFPIDDQHLVFYISAQDNRFHYVAQKGGDWADHSLAELEVDTKLRRFMVGQNEAGHFEIFALSEGKKCFNISLMVRARRGSWGRWMTTETSFRGRVQNVVVLYVCGSLLGCRWGSIDADIAVAGNSSR